MAPGILVVWSDEDPNAQNGTTFSDPITALPTTRYGVRLKLDDSQDILQGRTHSVPFLSLYHLSDVSAMAETLAQHSQKGGRRLEGACGIAPRLYELVERIEAEGCEGYDPAIGDLVSLGTRGESTKEHDDMFLAFHREGLVAGLLQEPDFLRCMSYKQVSPWSADNQPSSPYLFVYEWACEVMPWTELVQVAMKKEWVSLVENGGASEAGNYHTTSYSERSGKEAGGVEG